MFRQRLDRSSEADSLVRGLQLSACPRAAGTSTTTTAALAVFTGLG